MGPTMVKTGNNMEKVPISHEKGRKLPEMMMYHGRIETCRHTPCSGAAGSTMSANNLKGSIKMSNRTLGSNEPKVAVFSVFPYRGECEIGAQRRSDV